MSGFVYDGPKEGGEGWHEPRACGRSEGKACWQVDYLKILVHI